MFGLFCSVLPSARVRVGQDDFRSRRSSSGKRPGTWTPVKCDSGHRRGPRQPVTDGPRYQDGRSLRSLEVARAGLPPSAGPPTGAAPGTVPEALGGTPTGRGAPSFGDRSAFPSRKWAAWPTNAGRCMLASPSISYLRSPTVESALYGGVSAVGGSAPAASGLVSASDLRQMVTDVITLVATRLEQVEGQMRPSRRRGNRPVGDSTSNPTSSSSKEDEDAPNLRGARRASARTHRRVARVLSPGSGGEPPRVVPDKIVPDDDTSKVSWIASLTLSSLRAFATAKRRRTA